VYKQFCGKERTSFFVRGAGPRHGENAANFAQSQTYTLQTVNTNNILACHTWVLISP